MYVNPKRTITKVTMPRFKVGRDKKFKRINIYFPATDDALRRLNMRGGKQSMANTVRRDLGQLHGLLRGLTMKLWETFDSSEMSVLLQIFQGQEADYFSVWAWLDGGFLELVRSEVMMSELCDKWTVDPDKLVSKLENLDTLHLFALIDYLVVWWDMYKDKDRIKQMLMSFETEPIELVDEEEKEVMLNEEGVA